jgi:FAD:protein FMN transferase
VGLVNRQSPWGTGTTGVSRRGLLSLSWGAAEDDGAGHYIRVHRRAMACRFEVTLPGEHASDISAARDALEEANRLEELLSVFRESSAISQINKAAGADAIEIGDELFELLTRCRELDVTSTPLSRVWGFLQREGRLPSDEEIAAARALVGFRHLALEPGKRTATLGQAGMALNLGAIGKGFAVQAIGATLWRGGVRHALVSAGGSSVIALGGPDGGWRVDVVGGPLRQRLTSLRLRNAALGTSGAGEQFIEVNGIRYGHVIDPRTGWPASGILSASVVTADAATADALATAFFVGGLELARKYCDLHPGTLALITPNDGSHRPLVVGRYLGARVDV